MNKNSALIWLPAIDRAGLPTPKTIVVPYSHHECTPIFDGVASLEFERLINAVREQSERIGLPVFVRTDLGSAKHSGPAAYRLSESGKAAEVLFRLLEDQEMKFWLEPEGPKAVLVREFLSLKSLFTAFCGLPVNREFRFFSDGVKILCWHPYWPPEAIEDHVDDASYPDWRFDLQMLHYEPPVDLLGGMAIAAVGEIGHGNWSVDFAQDKNGKWWLIDMATAGDSFHWPGCEASAV
jgi:hypothetical protein